MERREQPASAPLDMNQWNQAWLLAPLSHPTSVSELRKERTRGSQFTPALFPFWLVIFWYFAVDEFIHSLSGETMYVSEEFLLY